MAVTWEVTDLSVDDGRRASFTTSLKMSKLRPSTVYSVVVENLPELRGLDIVVYEFDGDTGEVTDHIWFSDPFDSGVKTAYRPVETFDAGSVRL